MKVIMVDVLSLNGKITRGDDPHVENWTSAEDAAHFKDQIAASDVVVIGRATYQAIDPKPDTDHLRVIMTSKPADFSDRQVTGAVEFTDAPTEEIAANLERRGYHHVLIAGGSQINALWLQAGLVDEMYLTIEPRVFGSGTPLLSEASGLDIRCQLHDIQRLNEQGSVLLHYTVVEGGRESED